MYRIKRMTAAVLLTAALIFTVSSAYAESELIPVEDIKADNTNYNTVHPEYGTFTNTTSLNGSALIPDKTSVLYKGRPAKYVSTVAKHGDTVKEGDPLVEIKIEVDEYHLAELELKLQRAKESYTETEQAYISDINDLQKDLNKLPADDTFGRKTVTLYIEKARLELEQYRFEQNRTIADLQKELDEIYEDRDVQYIFAPCDGYVYDTVFFDDDATIYTNQPVCTLANLSSVLIRVSNDHFSCGMTATAEAGNNNNRVLLDSEIIISSNALGDASSTFAYLKPDLTEFDFTTMSVFALNIDRVIFNVKAETVHLENVLVIPKTAANADNDVFYVLKYGDDHVIHKRYIGVGQSSRDQCWVLYGVNESDSLITN